MDKAKEAVTYADKQFSECDVYYWNIVKDAVLHGIEIGLQMAEQKQRTELEREFGLDLLWYNHEIPVDEL